MEVEEEGYNSQAEQESDATLELDSDEVMIIEDEEESAVENPVIEPASATSQSRALSPALTSKDNDVSTTSSSQENTAPSKSDSDSDDGDDGRTCTICMDNWSNTGIHRLSSLKCGHLFGHSCILRWLQVGCPPGKKRCPQCNKKAFVKDIRLHYARKLVVLDTAERDRLKEELEIKEREKNQMGLELARANVRQQLHLNEIAELKHKILLLEAQSCNGQCRHKEGSLTQRSNENRQMKRLSLLQSVEICKDGGCRVLAYSEGLKLLVASQRSSNNLFPGYGIKKIDVSEFHRTGFVYLHTKAIRDMDFHPILSDKLLSVSLDRSAKLLKMSNNSIIQNCVTDTPLWSCCWDANNTNMFFVGTSNGAVLQYDMRSISEPLNKLTSLDDSSPVTSLAPIPANPGRTMPRGGILACRLNSCWSYELSGSEYVGSQLPFDGPFVSMCYDQNTEHILISTRPSGRYPHARHILSQLPQINATESSSLICNPIYVFKGSTSQNLLSRSCLVPLEGDTLVAAHQESLKSLSLWSMSSGRQLINSPISQPVIDLCPVQVNNKQHLATLSEKLLRIYSIE
ncbi:E3 ubiquitin-protein ligase RFWD3 [Blattella germanica]|nr:E3 ubiquitin-protein ligase RFWD3 [Blattella germanica]